MPEYIRNSINPYVLAGQLRSLRLVVPALILLSALIGRALFMEYTDLLDPTESRYATIAQDMLLSGDWVTPMIRMHEGLVPYLGKPPLHFWLTAISYSVFGFEEWSARLPSFLAALCILATVFAFCAKLLDIRVAISAALITCSSVLFFFLAGASVTDVTLTALVTVASALSYLFISSINSSRWLIWICAAVCGLAFLCKGPVAFVLVGFPLLLFSVLTQDVSWIRRIPWISCGLICMTVAAPWFILSELRNPGFSKYFFWNENIARYLMRDYGDRYGSGHSYWHGMSWIMTVLSFMPWSPILLLKIYEFGAKQTWAWMRSDKTLLFCLCWGLSAPIFFTLVRQLHGMYMLPAIPAISIFTAGLLLSPVSVGPMTAQHRNWKIALLVGVVWLSTVLIGLSYEFSALAMIISVCILVGGAFVVLPLIRNRTELGFVTVVSVFSIVTYLLVFASFSPFINQTRSAERILQELVTSTPAKINHIHQVGVFSDNSFSHYWTAGSWENELGEKVLVSPVKLMELDKSEVCHLLVRVNAEKDIPSEVSAAFTKVKQIGRWFLYKRTDPQFEQLQIATAAP